MGQFVSLGMLASLGIWGVLFLLQKISTASLVNPELGLVLPIVLAFIFSIFLYKQKVI
jgi:lipopolysaccharide export LptBFGC system permease protein LptF